MAITDILLRKPNVEQASAGSGKLAAQPNTIRENFLQERFGVRINYIIAPLEDHTQIHQTFVEWSKAAGLCNPAKVIVQSLAIKFRTEVHTLEVPEQRFIGPVLQRERIVTPNAWVGWEIQTRPMLGSGKEELPENVQIMRTEDPSSVGRSGSIGSKRFVDIWAVFKTPPPLQLEAASDQSSAA